MVGTRIGRDVLASPDRIRGGRQDERRHGDRVDARGAAQEEIARIALAARIDMGDHEAGQDEGDIDGLDAERAEQGKLPAREAGIAHMGEEHEESAKRPHEIEIERGGAIQAGLRFPPGCRWSRAPKGMHQGRAARRYMPTTRARRDGSG